MGLCTSGVPAERPRKVGLRGVARHRWLGMSVQFLHLTGSPRKQTPTLTIYNLSESSDVAGAVWRWNADKLSVRVIRVLKYNARWAAKLRKQQERAAQKRADDEAAAQRAKEQRTANPFAVGQSSAHAGGLFGGSILDAPAQGAPASAGNGEASDASNNGDDSDDENEYDADARVAEEMAIKASLEEQQTQLSDEAKAALEAYAEAAPENPRAHLDAMTGATTTGASDG